MKIALDYDCTLTAAPGLFTMFVRGAQADGHDIRIVTFRHPDNLKGGIGEASQELKLPVIFTSHWQKMEHCKKIGWIPDIWIDDTPAHIPTIEDMLSRVDDIVEAEETEDDEWLNKK